MSNEISCIYNAKMPKYTSTFVYMYTTNDMCAECFQHVWNPPRLVLPFFMLPVSHITCCQAFWVDQIFVGKC